MLTRSQIKRINYCEVGYNRGPEMLAAPLTVYRFPVEAVLEGVT